MCISFRRGTRDIKHRLRAKFAFGFSNSRSQQKLCYLQFEPPFLYMFFMLFYHVVAFKVTAVTQVFYDFYKTDFTRNEGREGKPQVTFKENI